MVKLADTTASKAVGLTSVGVQVPPRPFKIQLTHLTYNIYTSNVRETLTVLFICLYCLALSACSPKVTTVGEDRCYEIKGDEVIYTCSNQSAEESGSSTPGYDGPNNPKALNLYRPGRFEDINGIGW